MLFKNRLPKPDPEAEENFREDLYNHGGLEKHDLAALVIAAFAVILPVALLALLVMCAVAFLFI